MRLLPYLLLLVLLAGCTSKTTYDFYRAPRRTQRQYRQRQHLHQRERDRQLYQRLNYEPLGWLFPS